MDALKEVSMQETETPWMFDEYRYILDNAAQIEKVCAPRNQRNGVRSCCVFCPSSGYAVFPCMKMMLCLFLQLQQKGTASVP